MYRRTGLIIALSCSAILLTGCGQFRWHSDEYYQQLAIDNYITAQEALDSNDDDAALISLSAAVKADPTLSTAHAAIGDIYHKREDLQMAVSAYERAVAANAWNFRNHYNCAFLHQYLGQNSPSASELTNHLARSVELYKRAVKLYGKDYDAVLNLGVCQFLLERHSDAEANFKQAIELNGDLPDAYANLGLLYDKQGKKFDAVEMYNRSLEIDGNQTQVLLNMAAVRVRQGKINTATNNYRRATELDSNNSVAFERLAYCYFQNSQADMAYTNYLKALELDKRNYLAHRGIGIVLISRYLKDKNDTESQTQAIEHWQTSLELKPDQEDLKILINKYGKIKQYCDEKSR